MDSQRRSELKRSFKEAVIRKGIFKITCAATEQTWIDLSTNIDSIKNRLWFTLERGTHSKKAVQEAWNTCGSSSFSFEILELLDEDVPSRDVRFLLKKKKALWIEQMEATSLL